MKHPMDVAETAGGMDFSGPRLRPWQEDHGGPRGLREWHRFMAGKKEGAIWSKGCSFSLYNSIYVQYMYSIY